MQTKISIGGVCLFLFHLMVQTCMKKVINGSKWSISAKVHDYTNLFGERINTII